MVKTGKAVFNITLTFSREKMKVLSQSHIKTVLANQISLARHPVFRSGGDIQPSDTELNMHNA
jgi:hypothetical protein